MVRIGVIQNCQSLTVSKTDFAKGVHQFGEISRAEYGFRPGTQGAQVQKCLIDVTFSTGAGQAGQRHLTGREIEMTVRAHLNELVGANDVKFQWHNEMELRFSRTVVGRTHQAISRSRLRFALRLDEAIPNQLAP